MEVRKNRNGVNKMSLYIGTNYHPHDWPKERWEKDFQLMKEAGFDTVRLGHLCWDSYEPEDGVYTFEWFDQVMDFARDSIYEEKMELHRHRCADIWTMFLIQSIRSMHCGLLKKSFPVIKIIRRCLRLDCAMSWEQAIHPILKRRRRDFRNGWKRDIKQ